MAELYPYPRFSLAERDRRWKAVRELMREHRLDVIVTPQNSGHSTDYQANSRYLTHVGGGGDADVAAVFPLDGEVTAIATSGAALAHGAGLDARCARGEAELWTSHCRKTQRAQRRAWPNWDYGSRRRRGNADS